VSSEAPGTTHRAAAGPDALRLVAKRNRRLSHLAVWFLSLVPALLLVFDFFTMRLGVNPIETITNRTGWWAMTMLVLTLAITPLRRLFGWHALVRYRRQVGLATFIYASLHLATYALLDLGLDLSHLGEDIVKRPFITVGFAGWLLLLALAITSTNGWIRRLGKRWATLHKAVYLVAGLALLHFFWSQKADRSRPLQFLALFVLVLGVRVGYAWLKRRRAAIRS